MNIRHTNRSQVRLHDLFRGFAEIVELHIVKACQAIAGDPRKLAGEPIRILDLGAGEVPYRSAFKRLAAELGRGEVSRRLEITLVDKDTSLPKAEFEGCTCIWKYLDILTLLEEIRERRRYEDIGGPYDLLLMSASLHELYHDAISRKVPRWNPATFHEEFFDLLCRRSSLLASNIGRVIVADYAWADLADPNHLFEIAEEQFKAVEHADPAWTFVDIRRVLQCLLSLNYKVQASDRRGLFDQLDYSEIRKMLPGLSEGARTTLGLRTGYILTFEDGGLPVPSEPSYAEIQPRIRAISRQIVEMFQQYSSLDAENLRCQLNRILTQSTEGQGDHSPLVYLARAIYKDGQQALRPYRAPDPGRLEVWLGIGLRKFMNSRFIPRLRASWCGKEDYEAGILHPEEGAAPLAPLAGPVAIAYKHLLSRTDAPSIHNWCKSFHEAMHKETTIVGNVGQRNSAIFNSFTILSPQSREHDYAISAAWGDEKRQRETGHYILRLYPEDMKGCWAFEAAQSVLSELKGIADYILCGESDSVSWLPSNADKTQDVDEYTLWMFAIFLQVNFGFGGRKQLEDLIRILSDLQLQLTEDMLDRLLPILSALREELNIYGESITPERLDFDYTAFTTIAIGCNGISPYNPDTIILFSGHPIPPSGLNNIASYTSNLCRPIVHLEDKIDAERHAQTQAELDSSRRMIRAFGHDAKRPAGLIEWVLRAGNNLDKEYKIKLARELANELQERMSGYSSIIQEGMDLDKTRLDLWGRLKNAEAYNWRSISEIWKKTIAMSLLSICIRSDEQWPGLREKIINGEQVLEIIQSYPELGSMLKKTRNFEVIQYPPNLLLDLRVPETTRQPGASEEEARTFPTYYALQLIFSEIITNALRHEIPFALDEASLPIRLGLSCEVKSDTSYTKIQSSVSPVLVDMKITAQPRMKKQEEYIPRSYKGLLSLKDTGHSIGCTVTEQELKVGSPPPNNENDERRSIVVPFFNRYDDRIEWTISNIPLFR